MWITGCDVEQVRLFSLAGLMELVEPIWFSKKQATKSIRVAQESRVIRAFFVSVLWDNRYPVDSVMKPFRHHTVMITAHFVRKSVQFSTMSLFRRKPLLYVFHYVSEVCWAFYVLVGVFYERALGFFMIERVVMACLVLCGLQYSGS